MDVLSKNSESRICLPDNISCSAVLLDTLVSHVSQQDLSLPLKACLRGSLHNWFYNSHSCRVILTGSAQLKLCRLTLSWVFKYGWMGLVRSASSLVTCAAPGKLANRKSSTSWSTHRISQQLQPHRFFPGGHLHSLRVTSKFSPIHLLHWWGKAVSIKTFILLFTGT